MRRQLAKRHAEAELASVKVQNTRGALNSAFKTTQVQFYYHKLRFYMYIYARGYNGQAKHSYMHRPCEYSCHQIL